MTSRTCCTQPSSRRNRQSVWAMVAAGLLTALMLASCSDDDSAGSDAVAESGVADDLRSAAGDALADVEAPTGDNGDTIINVGGQEPAEAETSEKLPGWAWALIAVVAVISVVGLIVGLQNRNARKNEEATQRAIHEAQLESQRYQPPPPPSPPAGADAVPPPPSTTPEQPAPGQT